MITKNGRIILGAIMNGCSLSDSRVSMSSLINQNGKNATDVKNYSDRHLTHVMKNYNMNLLSSSGKFTYIYSTSNTSPSNEQMGTGICLSNDNTPESLDDYYLEDCGLTCDMISTNYYVTNSCIKTYSTLAVNTTSEPITVRTVGLYTESGANNFLIYKEVLDKPVTILPDESYTFTVSIK